MCVFPCCRDTSPKIMYPDSSGATLLDMNSFPLNRWTCTGEESESEALCCFHCVCCPTRFFCSISLCPHPGFTGLRGQSRRWRQQRLSGCIMTFIGLSRSCCDGLFPPFKNNLNAIAYYCNGIKMGILLLYIKHLIQPKRSFFSYNFKRNKKLFCVSKSIAGGRCCASCT